MNLKFISALTQYCTHVTFPQVGKLLLCAFSFVIFVLSCTFVHPNYDVVTSSYFSWLLYFVGILILSYLSFFFNANLNRSFYIRIGFVCLFGIYLVARGADVETILIVCALVLGVFIDRTLSISKKVICLLLASSSAILAIRVIIHIITKGTEFEYFGGVTVISLTMSLGMLSALELHRKTNCTQFKILLIITVIFEFLIIFLIKSRIGMICSIIICVNCVQNRIAKIVGLLSVISVFIVCNISSTKINSNIGRAFILQTSFKLIDTFPKAIIGLGDKGFEEHYMLKQARELDNKEPVICQLASNITHPLNEFVYFYIRYGVVGLFFLLIILSLAFSCRSRFIKFAVGIITLFSLFTYPLYYPISYIVITYALSSNERGNISIIYNKAFRIVVITLSGIMILLVACQYFSYCCWQKAYLYTRIGNYNKAEVYYDRASQFLSTSHFYYNQSHFELTRDSISEAAEIIKKCTKKDYDVTLFKAALFKSMKEYDLALSEYTLAYNMCPSKFLPLYEKYLIYEFQGDTTNMGIIKQEIKNKPIKIESVEVNKIRDYILK